MPSRRAITSKAIHPQLLHVIVLDAAKNRFGFFGDHAVAVAPFEVKNVAGFGPEEEIEGIRQLPATFPGVAEVLPAFEELVASYRDEDGEVRSPRELPAESCCSRRRAPHCREEAWT